MRAWRSPAETRFSGVFSSATTRMQSAGQAAAHSEQPTHFSSPFSCLCRRWRPRKRGYTARLNSGYCCVIGFRKICRKVTPKPLRVENGWAISGVSGRDARDSPARTEHAEDAGRPRTGTYVADRGRRHAKRSQPREACVSRPEAPLKRHHQDRRHDGVDGRHRKQHLPAEAHELVVSEPWERRPNPDEDEEQDDELSDE